MTADVHGILRLNTERERPVRATTDVGPAVFKTPCRAVPPLLEWAISLSATAVEFRGRPLYRMLAEVRQSAAWFRGAEASAQDTRDNDALRRAFTIAVKSVSGGPSCNQMEDANTKCTTMNSVVCPHDVQPDRGRVSSSSRFS
jgi:hypothetical protein